MNTWISLIPALLRRSVAVGLIAAAGIAGACEQQPSAAGDADGAAKSWVLSLNQKVSVAARCNAMVETINRMVAAGSALRISILGYDKPEGSRSLSLAYVATVTDELRTLLQQKIKGGQFRIRTMLGNAPEGASVEPDATGRIEIRVLAPGDTAGS